MLSDLFGSLGTTTQVATIAATTVATCVWMVARARVKRDRLKYGHERNMSKDGALAGELHEVVKKFL